MEYPSVQNMILQKPKKNGSTYFANIFVDKRKNPFILELENVLCFHRNGNMYIKSKSLMMYMIDIASYITENVKNNCSEWFHNNMNVDLIDDYYDNVIKFDKEHGNVVRIKCINSLDIFNTDKYNVHIKFHGLRFSKQKFYIEFEVMKFEKYEVCEDVNIFIETSDDYLSSDEDNEDIPEPIPEGRGRRRSHARS